MAPLTAPRSTTLMKLLDEEAPRVRTPMSAADSPLGQFATRCAACLRRHERLFLTGREK
ncbi:hypothetical protein PHO31112_03204 [Pandoraea horticolens]|uniref:Uncharacterized protein n=1 Tax=Pandoraea horticolens TaxID=2508298 RepID=A0A5E4WDI5_9BURK|nr:hypothetical protein [Pandoraea horticolens]VVE22451.1 hypothetical protein PHO31112_03204 [Pandoraea horticolens]